MNAYMTCPKCQNAMQPFTRSGLTVEQCTQCRGVFLDYGELEHLVRAESAYNQQIYAQPAPPMPPGPQQPMHQPAPAHYASSPLGAFGHGQSHGHGHKRRKSFLQELFED